MKRVIRVWVSGAVILTTLCAASFSKASQGDDERAILDHIHGIFQAYMEADTATIRATHSADWTGFNNQSRAIVHGIDAYMANARRALAGARIIRYELEDVDIQIHGDVGVVYYVANWTTKLNASDVRIRMHVRSVDIYEKRGGGWIQIGSNLNSLTRPGSMSKPECGECFDIELEDGP